MMNKKHTRIIAWEQLRNATTRGGPTEVQGGVYFFSLERALEVVKFAPQLCYGSAHNLVEEMPLRNCFLFGELLECREVQSPTSETSSGDKQELPLSNFQKPNLLLQKEKNGRHSAVEDVAEEEGTRVETHNSILSLKMVHHYPLQQL
ncbi:hypothetical protein L3X38_025146 [Prunus dulcis]|uniref:Uncharacterized protein n=1 Tax=Prunus dulcis TaxID=3755 RepID=A0AAD4W198_PRUDU|nr:hypothetical protein L3X38_025146 [Prunus dulcis]